MPVNGDLRLQKLLVDMLVDEKGFTSEHALIIDPKCRPYLYIHSSFYVAKEPHATMPIQRFGPGAGQYLVTLLGPRVLVPTPMEEIDHDMSLVPVDCPQSLEDFIEEKEKQLSEKYGYDDDEFDTILRTPSSGYDIPRLILDFEGNPRVEIRKLIGKNKVDEFNNQIFDEVVKDAKRRNVSLNDPNFGVYLKKIEDARYHAIFQQLRKYAGQPLDQVPQQLLDPTKDSFRIISGKLK